MGDLEASLENRVWSFDWGDIQGEVSALGGMLGPVTFSFPDGTVARPFAVGPWASDPPERLATLPPLLRRLRGEWPCVPFGVSNTRTDLPREWMNGVDSSIRPADSFMHGYGSNQCWDILERGDDRIALVIDYPEDHPVRRLRRRICREEGLALVVTLDIEMRRDAILPVGLHPVFALPRNAGNAKLEIPSATMVRTFPVAVEPGVSRLKPDQVASSLADVKTNDGNSLDLTALPLEVATEELVLVSNCEGRAILSDRSCSVETILEWDAHVFPQCLLWISNRGRSQYPWNGRFTAIGIEPVAAAFDLGEAHSINPDSPLRQGAIQTALTLTTERVFSTTYRLAVSKVT